MGVLPPAQPWPRYSDWFASVSSCRRSRVRLPTERPYPRRSWPVQCRSRLNDQMSSRCLTIVPYEPSSPLDIHQFCPTKPIHAISPHTQPDPTNPMDNRPSFSRCLAGATRTPLRPPDTPRSRPSPLVSSNSSPTSHAELGLQLVATVPQVNFPI